MERLRFILSNFFFLFLSLFFSVLAPRCEILVGLGVLASFAIFEVDFSHCTVLVQIIDRNNVRPFQDFSGSSILFTVDNL